MPWGSHPGGRYPYPIMLCNISQNAMGQPLGGGYPARSSWGGTLPGPAGGGTLAGGYPGQVPPLARSARRGGPGGGVPDLGTPPPGYPPARVPPTRVPPHIPPQLGTPPAGYPPWGVPGGYPGQGTIGSTCSTAGGMPLAFTQEDFLVLFVMKNSILLVKLNPLCDCLFLKQF